ncbi:MAG: DUF2062 domain-containing protein [Acidobacteria bacterium]|jgi:hypothetical protein|nr:DUF2062 domain-containing protein [Acidobacteriota bacterium]
MRQLRRLARLVLRLQGTPTQVARAFSIGVFLAFFPVYGLHTLLAFGLALAFRLNKVAILAGTFVNNPWTIAPMYTAGTLLGTALLGVPPAAVADIDWSLSGQEFYASFSAGFRRLLWPFVTGNLVLGVVAGTVAFFAMRAILESRRRGAPDEPGTPAAGR